MLAGSVVVPLVLAYLVFVLVSSVPRPADPLAGAGDPYFPDYGASGYDARSYLIDITVEPERLGGVTTMTAVTTQELAVVHLDLALPVSAVQVDGRDADFEQNPGNDLAITAPEQLATGRQFEVRVEYAGDPGAVQLAGTRPWQRQGEDQGVAGQPESSAVWFPANDHPSDPATMEMRIRAPRGLQVVSTGALLSRDLAEEDDWNTWHWSSDDPMATYLNFLMVGRYDLVQDTVDGRPGVYAVSARLSEEQRTRAMASLRTTGDWIAKLEDLYGPYPFDQIGGVVVPFDYWYAALETQTRPVYVAEPFLARDYTDVLLVHELAHMWVGDKVTLQRWDDIFLNEGYARWTEWQLLADDPDASFQRAWQRHDGRREFWSLSLVDPGADHLFDASYDRGGMALQALATLVGRDKARAIARSWVTREGPHSLEQWHQHVLDQTTGTDLEPWWQAWFVARTQPVPSAEIGFPR